MESETQYDLTTPFTYSFQGEQLTASHIILHEPSAPQLGEVGKIRKWVNSALRTNREALDEEGEAVVAEAQEAAAEAAEADLEDEDEDDGPIDPGSVIALMARGDIPLDQFYLTCAKILHGNGIAFVDGTTKMTPPLWKKLSGRDMEMMVGQYVGVFFLR